MLTLGLANSFLAAALVPACTQFHTQTNKEPGSVEAAGQSREEMLQHGHQAATRRVRSPESEGRRTPGKLRESLMARLPSIVFSRNLAVFLENFGDDGRHDRKFS
jgi:hypothetical protein